MLSHSVGICKRRKADSFKTSEGVSALPLYSYKTPAAAHKSGKRLLRISAQIQEFVIKW
jgi:hypothetical protein